MRSEKSAKRRAAVKSAVKDQGPLPLTEVHTRLFSEDVEQVKVIANKQGIPWQIELRLLVRRALRGERREVLVLTDKEPST